MELSIASWGLLARLSRSLDATIRKEGLQGGMDALLKRFGVKLQITYDSPKVVAALQSAPLVIVANHPSESDPIVFLASLAKRKDIYLVANSFLLGISNALDHYLLPVYIDYRIRQKENTGSFKLDILKRIHKIPSFDRAIEHQKNIETLQKAYEKESQNGVVVIFHGAGGGRTGKWFSGVGYLIKNITHKDARIVMAYIENTSDKDYARIIPGISKLLKAPKIRFSNPLMVADYHNVGGKEIAHTLEKKYWEWANESTSRHQN